MQRFIGLSCLVLALACTQAGYANFVNNGSFENGFTDPGDGTQIPSGWTRTGGQTYIVNDPGGNAVDGSYYMQCGQYTELGQITSHVLVEGETLRFSGYARNFGVNDVLNVRLYANPNPQNGNIQEGIDFLYLDMTNSPGAMTLYTTDYVVPASIAGTTMGVYIASQANWRGLDAISVVVVPEPTIGALLMGAPILLLRRRRSR